MRIEGKVYSIDLGATNLRIGIVDQDLKIIDVVRERTTKNDPLKLYAQIRRMLDEISEKNNFPVKHVGVSLCGFVEDQKIKYLPNLNINDFDLVYHLKEDFGDDVQVYLANDANAAAFAEATYGSASEVEDSFFYTISSGIGACLVSDRKLINLAFEVGHAVFKYKNNFYEFEELLSGNGLVKLCSLNGLKIKDASEFFKLVEENKDKNDKLITQIYDDWIVNLAAFIANNQLYFNVDKIVLSGGVMKSSKLFLDDLTSITNAFIARYPVKKINFVNAKFDQDVGFIGGASVGLSLLEKK